MNDRKTKVIYRVGFLFWNTVYIVYNGNSMKDCLVFNQQQQYVTVCAAESSSK